MSKRTPEPLDFPGAGLGASLPLKKQRRRKKKGTENSAPFPTELPGNHVPNMKVHHPEEPEISSSQEIEK